MMPRYYVTFLGRRRGAVGQSWAYAQILTAETPHAAILGCRARYDDVSSVSVVKVDPETPALPHDRLRLRPGIETGCGQPCGCCYVIPTNTAAHRALAAGLTRAEVRA